MKRVIFLSKSKLAGNLIKFLLAESPIDCLCLNDEAQLTTKLLLQKKLIIILDHSFLSSISEEKLERLNPVHLEKSQQLFFFQDPISTKPLPFPVHESIEKPFLADDLIQKLSSALGVSL